MKIGIIDFRRLRVIVASSEVALHWSKRSLPDFSNSLLEKLATSQPGRQRPEDIRKELFEAFGGVPRIQQLHVAAKQLIRHRFDDEALQLLNKTLVVTRWGGAPAQQTTEELRD